MINVLKDLKIENYRNVRNTKLKDLRDINIIIGPNNCGKTTILNFISNFTEISISGALTFLCSTCQKVPGKDKIKNFSYPLNNTDKFLHKGKVKAELNLNEKTINSEVPRATKKTKEILKNKAPCHTKEIILLESPSGLICEHVSVFSHEAILEEIKNNILFCPEQRLENYKGKGFSKFLRENRKLSSAQKHRWIDFLQKVIDPKIDDERYERLIRKENSENFEDAISNQGSGVRSLVCLAADILFSHERILLIDEPELGLNPSVKQAFLKFLIDTSKEKQIFIATHDPTFVNPLLFRTNNASIYVFSPIYDKETSSPESPNFVKVNLQQSKEDPYTFGGFLPHPESLKPIHIYVEGKNDVNAIQKILIDNYKDKLSILNKIGVFHLAGDFWKHLLYTIPLPPEYNSIVILDHDKRDEAKKVCETYNAIRVISPKFKFCSEVEELNKSFKSTDTIPVYCLKEKCVEDLDSIEEESLKQILKNLIGDKNAN